MYVDNIWSSEYDSTEKLLRELRYTGLFTTPNHGLLKVYTIFVQI